MNYKFRWESLKNYIESKIEEEEEKSREIMSRVQAHLIPGGVVSAKEEFNPAEGLACAVTLKTYAFVKEYMEILENAVLPEGVEE